MANSAWWDKGADIINSLNSNPEISQTVKKSYSSITKDEIGKAFKEALNIGSKNVVKQLGDFDGFNADPAIHIPLPEQLKTVRTLLNKVGMSTMADNLELKLNRAAEKATPKAKELFKQAISDMTFDDVMNIYNGPKDSATKYFQKKMRQSLRTEMQPDIEQTLSQVGAIQVYDNLMGQYKQIPFVPDVKADLTNYVLGKGLDGIFYYMAKEETAIRENPARQTTNLLKKVFGSAK